MKLGRYENYVTWNSSLRNYENKAYVRDDEEKWLIETTYDDEFYLYHNCESSSNPSCINYTEHKRLLDDHCQRCGEELPKPLLFLIKAEGRFGGAKFKPRRKRGNLHKRR